MKCDYLVGQNNRLLKQREVENHLSSALKTAMDAFRIPSQNLAYCLQWNLYHNPSATGWYRLRYYSASVMKIKQTICFRKTFSENKLFGLISSVELTVEWVLTEQIATSSKWTICVDFVWYSHIHL